MPAHATEIAIIIDTVFRHGFKIAEASEPRSGLLSEKCKRCSRCCLYHNGDVFRSHFLQLLAGRLVGGPVRLLEHGRSERGEREGERER